MKTKEGRDLRLDSIRGLSALLVFFFHINGYINPSLTTVQKVCDFGADLLFIGLHLFFVLSGYSLMKFTREYSLQHSWWNYVKRRIRRVLPAYLGTTVIWFLLPLLKQLASSMLPFIHSDSSLRHVYGYQSFVTLFLNLTLLQWFLPVPGVVLSGVTWSLVVETQFYFLFPILVRYVTRHSLLGVLVPFLVCQIFSLYLAAKFGHSVLFLKVSVFSYILVFYAGMYLAQNDIKPLSISWRVFCLCLVVFWVFWTTYVKESTNPAFVVFGELGSGTVAVIMFKELITLSMPPGLLYMLGRFGLVSFSFYLVHLNVSDKVTQLVFRFVDSPVRISLAFLASFCLSLLVAVLAYNLFENWNKTLLGIRGWIKLHQQSGNNDGSKL